MVLPKVVKLWYNNNSVLGSSSLLGEESPNTRHSNVAEGQQVIPVICLLRAKEVRAETPRAKVKGTLMPCVLG